MIQKLASIYKFTNTITGKSYIGFTTNVKGRLSSHRSNYSNRKHATYKYKIYASMRKHGFDKFTFEILYQSDNIVHTKDVMEKQFIAEYDAYTDGYNMTVGGEGTFGRMHSEATKLKIKNIVRKSFESGERKPTIHTEQWKECLRNNNAGGKATALKVFQFDLVGNMIRQFDSARQAALFINGHDQAGGNILQACIKPQNTYKGFYWRKSDHQDAILGRISNIPELLEILRKSKYIKSHNKPIQQIDQTGKLIKSYESISAVYRNNQNFKKDKFKPCVDKDILYEGYLWKSGS